MRGLDTNVLVRYLTQDDPRQSERANALIAEAVAKRERLHLDVVVLCEVVWVLRGAYAFDKATVVDALEKILAAAQFSIEDRDIVTGATAAYAQGSGDFADYVIGARNQAAGCRHTVTFDRRLKKSRLFTAL